MGGEPTLTRVVGGTSRGDVGLNCCQTPSPTSTLPTSHAEYFSPCRRTLVHISTFGPTCAQQAAFPIRVHACEVKKSLLGGTSVEHPPPPKSRAVPPPTLPPRQQHSDMPICPSKQQYTNGVGWDLKWSGCSVRIRLWPPSVHSDIVRRDHTKGAALVPASALYSTFRSPSAVKQVSVVWVFEKEAQHN